MNQNQFFETGLKLIATFLLVTSSIHLIQLVVFFTSMITMGGITPGALKTPGASSMLTPFMQLIVGNIIFFNSKRIADSIYKSSESGQ